MDRLDRNESIVQLTEFYTRTLWEMDDEQLKAEFEKHLKVAAPTYTPFLF